MFARTKIFLAGITILCGGCQSVEEAADARQQTPPVSGDDVQSIDAGVDPDEIEWADEAFLDAAGVREGKDAMYLPTPPMVIEKMIELADIQASDLVFDLGTGDGRIAIETAKRIGCKVIGYEFDPEFVALARKNVRASDVGHLVTIEQRDVLTLDFSEVDVVLMYLDPELNVKLIPQLEKLKPGARVVSHDWGMDGKIESDVVIENFRSNVPDFVNIHTIYLWRAPIRRTD